MKIRFYVGNAVTSHSKIYDTEKDLGYSDEEWAEMAQEDKHSIAVEWATDYLDIWYEEL